MPVGEGVTESVGEGDGVSLGEGVAVALGSGVGVGDSCAKADEAVHRDAATTASASVARAPPPRNRDIYG